jgi:UDP-N-acetylglucosamine 3-dehydrogenase
MGAVHAKTIATSSGGRLTICCDVNPSRVSATPDGARFTTDLSEVFDEDLNLVVIATPESMHAPLAGEALSRGLHVFCEKPIADSIEAADAMIDAAQAAKRLLCVGHVCRFDQRYLRAHAAVAAGQLGRIRHIAAARLTHAGERDYYAPRTSLGVELAVHDLDILRWFAGDITSVFAVETEGVPADSLMALVRFRTGAIGSIETSWGLPETCAQAGGSRLHVLGDAGTLTFDGTSEIEFHQSRSPLEPAPQASFVANGDPFRVEIEHFFACVAGQASWPLSLQDARVALAAALALNRSVQAGGPIALAPTTNQETQ